MCFLKTDLQHVIGVFANIFLFLFLFLYVIFNPKTYLKAWWYEWYGFPLLVLETTLLLCIHLWADSSGHNTKILFEFCNLISKEILIFLKAMHETTHSSIQTKQSAFNQICSICIFHSYIIFCL